MTETSIYEENGVKNRREYLLWLTDEYNVSAGQVFALASVFGPNEDFDGLVTTLEDMEM